MATQSLVVASDGRPGSVPLTLRPLVNEDTPALQEMLDDPGIREVMAWRDDEYRDAGLAIGGLQDEQIDFYRYKYTFGIAPDHADTLADIAIVTIGQAEPARIPPAWQTDLTIFFAQQFHRPRPRRNRPRPGRVVGLPQVRCGLFVLLPEVMRIWCDLWYSW